LNAPLNAKRVRILNKNEPIQITPPPKPLLADLDGSNRTKNESICEVKDDPETYGCRLPNAPKIVENAQISGKIEPLYDGGTVN
jgi:hypothetical protein